MKFEIKWKKISNAGDTGIWYFVLSLIYIAVLSVFSIIPEFVYWTWVLLMLISTQLGRIKLKK